MPKTFWETFSLARKKDKVLGASMVFFIMLGNIAEQFSPYFLKKIADYAALNPHTFEFSAITIYIILYISLLLVQEIGYRIAHFTEIFVFLNVYNTVNRTIFHSLLERPTTYFEDKFSGELSRRVEQVGEGVTHFITDFPWRFIWVFNTALVSLVLLYIADPLLSLVTGIWMLVFTVIVTPLLRWEYGYTQGVASAHSALGGEVVDALTNIQLIHATGAANRESARFGSGLVRVLALEKKERLLFVLNRFVHGLGILILSSALVITSAYLFEEGRLSLGDFILVAATLPALIGMVWSANEVIGTALRKYGTMQDALRDLEATTVERISEGEREISSLDTSLSFEHVSFMYPGTNDKVFDDLTLTIKKGERVGIVGHSGAGKSTLIKLLLRQYDPNEGSIRIGANDTRDVTLASLRKAIAFVPQDTSLFHRSLYENIAYAKENATRDEVVAVSRRAHAHEFIEATPQKYETLVGERGMKLSGGQRQRIAIARAMLKDAPVLILDEATSALDSESEEIVQEGLHELFEGRTVIAIAHRLSTLREMDRIVVIENGKIVEDGNPKDLLAKKKGVFKDLWEHQKGGFVE